MCFLSHKINTQRDRGREAPDRQSETDRQTEQDREMGRPREPKKETERENERVKELEGERESERASELQGTLEVTLCKGTAQHCSTVCVCVHHIFIFSSHDSFFCVALKANLEYK